jgi:(2Fe-2S) ferredoxin
MRFERHLFVCVNERGPDDPRGCCAAWGSEAIAKALKAAAHERGLKGRVRVNKAGCLDACADGVSAVIYPEGLWYRHITLDDVDEIVERTLMRGEVIERLRAPDHPRARQP